MWVLVKCMWRQLYLQLCAVLWCVCEWDYVLCLCSWAICMYLLIYADNKSLLKVWSCLNSSKRGKLECKPRTQCIVFVSWLAAYCMYIYCRWLSSQDILHVLFVRIGVLCWRREGNAAFFRGAWLFGREQSLWRKNKAENRLLWHCGRLQFFHRWWFYAHIRTHKVNMYSLPFPAMGL